MKRYYLPDELRYELRKLHGVLYNGDGIDTAKEIIKNLNNPAKIITVGDIVTFNMLNAGLVPNLSYVDDKTKRSPVSNKIIQGTKHYDFKIVIVENPAGMITDELINETKKALNSENLIQIFVKGEEDLAALPAIALAPLSSVIIYGLPDKGAVLVRVTENKKIEIQSLLDKMICKEE